MPDLRFERELHEQGFTNVAGVDEVGRGCLAGPVVAAAVILPIDYGSRVGETTKIDDSKRLTPEQRKQTYATLTADLRVIWAVGLACVEEIDTMNILRASQEAMRRAVGALALAPSHALVDGLPFEPFPVPLKAVVGGDRRCLSIAAASVIAKVTRDRLMADLDQSFPGYGFADNKGYGTPSHLDALRRLGPSPHHRRTFSPVRVQSLPGFSRAGS